MESIENNLEVQRPTIQQRTSEDEENSGCCSSAICDPDRSCYRFIGLVFMCLIGIGWSENNCTHM